MRKRVGPRIEPWGTPYSIGTFSSVTSVAVDLSVRYDENQDNASPRTPTWQSLPMRILCVRLSKAFFTSRKMAAGIRLESKDRRINWRSLLQASSVGYFARNPNWCWWKKKFSFKKSHQTFEHCPFKYLREHWQKRDRLVVHRILSVTYFKESYNTCKFKTLGIYS